MGEETAGGVALLGGLEALDGQLEGGGVVGVVGGGAGLEDVVGVGGGVVVPAVSVVAVIAIIIVSVIVIGIVIVAAGTIPSEHVAPTQGG